MFTNENLSGARENQKAWCCVDVDYNTDVSNRTQISSIKSGRILSVVRWPHKLYLAKHDPPTYDQPRQLRQLKSPDNRTCEYILLYRAVFEIRWN